jgi:hypothetical protein
VREKSSDQWRVASLPLTLEAGGDTYYIGAEQLPSTKVDPEIFSTHSYRNFGLKFSDNALIYNGRILAQFEVKPLKSFTEHVPLNQRVLGSSPSAPTK